MNGFAYNSSPSPVGSDSMDPCESFLGSYSRGDIDVGGPNLPEAAKLDVPLEILSIGDFSPPEPPDETQRVRELYAHLFIV